MNWLDRYVESVKRYLPRNKRDDIGDELRSVLEDKFDEAKDAGDGSLTEAVELGILRDYGHPLTIASSYQDQRVLVSEPLFPIYKTTIKYMLFIFVALFAANSIANAVGWFRTVDFNFVSMGLWYFALITVGFYALDGYLRKVDFFANWEPKRLPPLTAATAGIDVGYSITSIVFVVIWFWILAAIDDTYSWAALVGNTENPLVTALLWAKVHAVLSLALCVYQLFRPYWTPGSRVFDGATSLVAVCAVGVALTVAEPHASILALFGTSAEQDDPVIRDMFWRVNLSVILLVFVGLTAYNFFRATQLARGVRST